MNYETLFIGFALGLAAATLAHAIVVRQLVTVILTYQKHAKRWRELCDRWENINDNTAKTADEWQHIAVDYRDMLCEAAPHLKNKVN